MVSQVMGHKSWCHVAWATRFSRVVPGSCICGFSVCNLLHFTVLLNSCSGLKIFEKFVHHCYMMSDLLC